MIARLAKALTVLALAAVIATIAWRVRTRLHAWTHDQIAGQISGRLAPLPERRAVRLVRQLAAADDEWLAVLVPAMADARPAVASAATSEVEQLVERWSRLPPVDSWPRVERLAVLLAQHGAQLPAERVSRAQSLAQRLLDWPAGGRRAQAAEFIAICEIVLRLTPAESDDIRVATTQP